jgi:hypothetical protein
VVVAAGFPVWVGALGLTDESGVVTAPLGPALGAAAGLLELPQPASRAAEQAIAAAATSVRAALAGDVMCVLLPSVAMMVTPHTTQVEAWWLRPERSANITV